MLEIHRSGLHLISVILLLSIGQNLKAEVELLVSTESKGAYRILQLRNMTANTTDLGNLNYLKKVTNNSNTESPLTEINPIKVGNLQTKMTFVPFQIERSVPSSMIELFIILGGAVGLAAITVIARSGKSMGYKELIFEEDFVTIDGYSDDGREWEEGEEESRDDDHYQNKDI